MTSVANFFEDKPIRVLDALLYCEWPGDQGRFRYLVASANGNRRSSKSRWFGHDELSVSERDYLHALASADDLLGFNTRVYDSQRAAESATVRSIIDASLARTTNQSNQPQEFASPSPSPPPQPLPPSSPSPPLPPPRNTLRKAKRFKAWHLEHPDE